MFLLFYKRNKTCFHVFSVLMFGFTNIHDFNIKTLLSLLLILYVSCELGIIYIVFSYSPYLMECVIRGQHVNSTNIFLL